MIDQWIEPLHTNQIEHRLWCDDDYYKDTTKNNRKNNIHFYVLANDESHLGLTI